MAFRKGLLLVSAVLLVISIKFTGADCSLLHEDAAALKPQDDSASIPNSAELELQRLKSKISDLETRIEDQTSELRSKDDGVKQLEEVVEEKSNIMTSLQSALLLFQASVQVDRIREVKTRVYELEKQIVNLEREIEAQKKKKDALEARVNVAENKIKELNLKLENLHRITDEQKSIIRKTQHALEVAEEEMLKAKLESYSVIKQLKEAHVAWLPPWLYGHLIQCQSFVLTWWNGIGRPAMGWTLRKTLEKKYDIEEWVKPYLEILKTEARMFVKPYVDHVSEITKPHLDRAGLFLKPYSKPVIDYHKKISNTIRVYHLWVQATLHRMLNSCEFTKPLAMEWLVRLMCRLLF